MPGYCIEFTLPLGPPNLAKYILCYHLASAEVQQRSRGSAPSPTRSRSSVVQRLNILSAIPPPSPDELQDPWR